MVKFTESEKAEFTQRVLFYKSIGLDPIAAISAAYHAHHEHKKEEVQ